jgi:hypothetical protein
VRATGQPMDSVRGSSVAGTASVVAVLTMLNYRFSANNDTSQRIARPASPPDIDSHGWREIFPVRIVPGHTHLGHLSRSSGQRTLEIDGS